MVPILPRTWKIYIVTTLIKCSRLCTLDAQVSCSCCLMITHVLSLPSYIANLGCSKSQKTTTGLHRYQSSSDRQFLTSYVKKDSWESQHLWQFLWVCRYVWSFLSVFIEQLHASTSLPPACGRQRCNYCCAKVRIRPRAMSHSSRTLVQFCPPSPGKQEVWLSFVVYPMLGMLGLKGRQLITAPLLVQHKKKILIYWRY